ncbi:MAG: hypothetical protein AVDCRST_MAG23-544, partial [uncultured Sphingosinicella sp.]
DGGCDHPRARDASAACRARHRQAQHEGAARARRLRSFARPLSADRRRSRALARHLVVAGSRKSGHLAAHRRLRPAAARPCLDPGDARPALDHAHHRRPRRAAGRSRPVSPGPSSELSRRRRRDRRSPTGFWAVAGGAGLQPRQCGRPGDPHPRGGEGLGGCRPFRL